MINVAFSGMNRSSICSDVLYSRHTVHYKDAIIKSEENIFTLITNPKLYNAQLGTTHTIMSMTSDVKPLTFPFRIQDTSLEGTCHHSGLSCGDRPTLILAQMAEKQTCAIWPIFFYCYNFFIFMSTQLFDALFLSDKL